jgi:hypothetical protein
MHMSCDLVSRDPIREQFADYVAPDVCYLLTIATGFVVEVYQGAGRIIAPELKSDTVFQIMRGSEAPGRGHEFWSWYVAEMPQWFPTPIEAAAAFLEHWRLWLDAGENPN